MAWLRTNDNPFNWSIYSSLTELSNYPGYFRELIYWLSIYLDKLWFACVHSSTLHFTWWMWCMRGLSDFIQTVSLLLMHLLYMVSCVNICARKRTFKITSTQYLVTCSMRHGTYNLAVVFLLWLCHHLLAYWYDVVTHILQGLFTGVILQFQWSNPEEYGHYTLKGAITSPIHVWCWRYTIKLGNVTL